MVDSLQANNHPLLEDIHKAQIQKSPENQKTLLIK